MDETTTLTILVCLCYIRTNSSNLREIFHHTKYSGRFVSTKADKKGEETKNYIFLSYKIVCRELETREINSLRLVVALNYRSQFDALVSSSLDVAQSMQIIKLLVDMFGF